MLHNEVAPCVASLVCIVAINKALADDLSFLHGANVTEAQLPVVAVLCDLVQELFPIVHIPHNGKQYITTSENVNP